MRFLHSADWHLGRIFHGVHLTEDQAVLLDQLVDLARDERVDAVLIAGDVYDRAVPPAEAVRLLGEVLDRLVGGLGVPVVLIAGNHDSPERIGFCADALAAGGLHVFGPLPKQPRPLTLHDEHGPVHIWGLPYAEPATARDAFEDETLTDHRSAFAEACRRCLAARPAAGRAVLVAHAFVGGGLASESERPLSVGGAGEVDGASLAGFDYVALGHLHRPQRVGADHIRYAGSLMPYSFSEAAHQTSVSLVELDADGRVDCRQIPLSPRRRVRSVQGSLAELLAAARDDPRPDDYVQAVLTDPGILRDPLGRLRKYYPKVLHIVRAQAAPGAPDPAAAAARRQKSVTDLFAEFYAHKRERPLDDARRAIFEGIVADLERRDREA